MLYCVCVSDTGTEREWFFSSLSLTPSPGLSINSLYTQGDYTFPFGSVFCRGWAPVKTHLLALLTFVYLKQPLSELLLISHMKLGRMSASDFSGVKVSEQCTCNAYPIRACGWDPRAGGKLLLQERSPRIQPWHKGFDSPPGCTARPINPDNTNTRLNHTVGLTLRDEIWEGKHTHVVLLRTENPVVSGC